MTIRNEEINKLCLSIVESECFDRSKINENKGYYGINNMTRTKPEYLWDIVKTLEEANRTDTDPAVSLALLNTAKDSIGILNSIVKNKSTEDPGKKPSGFMGVLWTINHKGQKERHDLSDFLQTNGEGLSKAIDSLEQGIKLENPGIKACAIDRDKAGVNWMATYVGGVGRGYGNQYGGDSDERPIMMEPSSEKIDSVVSRLEQNENNQDFSPARPNR